MDEPAFPQLSWALTLFVAGIIIIVTLLPFPTGAAGYDLLRIDSPYLFTAFTCLAFPSAFMDPKGMRAVGISAPVLCVSIEIVHHLMHQEAAVEHLAASILGMGFGVVLGRFCRWAIFTRNL